MAIQTSYATNGRPDASMQQSCKPSWADTLEDYWRLNLSEKKAARWEERMRYAIRNFSNELADSAIVWAKREQGDGDDGKFKHAPTVDQVISWIFAYMTKGKNRHEVVQDAGERLAATKRKIARMTSNIERWDVICDEGQDVGECNELLSYAQGFADFKCPTWREMGWLPMKQELEAIFARTGIRRVS